MKDTRLLFLITCCLAVSSFPGCDPSRRLFEAAEFGDYQTFSRLLTEQNVNTPVERPGYGSTRLLHVACGRLRVEYVRLLLDKGADVDLRDSSGGTCIAPLIGATTIDNVDAGIEILEILAQRSPELITQECDSNNGNTALHYAALYGLDERVIKELLKLGANVNATNAKGETPHDLYTHERHGEPIAAVEELLRPK